MTMSQSNFIQVQSRIFFVEARTQYANLSGKTSVILWNQTVIVYHQFSLLTYSDTNSLGIFDGRQRNLDFNTHRPYESLPVLADDLLIDDIVWLGCSCRQYAKTRNGAVDFPVNWVILLERPS